VSGIAVADCLAGTILDIDAGSIDTCADALSITDESANYFADESSNPNAYGHPVGHRHGSPGVDLVAGRR